MKMTPDEYAVYLGIDPGTVKGVCNRELMPTSKILEECGARWVDYHHRYIFWDILKSEYQEEGLEVEE